MRILKHFLIWTAVATTALAQAGEPDRGEAYYQYSLAHLFAQLAAEENNPDNYIDQAIEAYKAALEADPGSARLAEELSDFYIQTNRLREAREQAQDALDRDPNDISAHRILARIYVRQIQSQGGNRVNTEMLSNAINEYIEVVRLDPEDVDSLILLGRLHRIAGSSDAARDAFDAALMVDPNNEDALTGLAALFLEMDDFETAAELFERVTANNPTATSLQALAGTYEQMGEPALAAATLRRALALNPPNIDELREAMARDLINAGEIEQAADVFAEIAADDPTDVTVQLMLARIYAELGEFEKVRSAIDAALAVDPNNVDVRATEVAMLQQEGQLEEATDKMQRLVDDTERSVYSRTEIPGRLNMLEQLAILYRLTDQPEQAVAVYNEMLALDDTAAPRITAEIINSYRSGRMFEEAEQAADQALEDFPGNRTIILTRALLLAELGRVDEGADAVKELLDGSDDRGTYLALAEVYDKGKRFDDALSALDEAETLSLLDEEKISVWFMRGAVYERAQDVAAAEREFRKVLDMIPEHAPTLNYLGYMLADRNMRLDESLQLIEMALAAEPNNGAYLDSLGWVYYRMGRFAEAEVEIKRAVDVTPADPTMFDHYADVLIAQDKVDEAVAAYEEALRQWQDSSPSDQDPAQIEMVQQKLRQARARLSN